MENPESFAQALLKTAGTLRTAAHSALRRDLSRLAPPEADASTTQWEAQA